MKPTCILLVPIVLISAMMFSGCQDDEGTSTDIVPFAINFQSKFGTEDMNYNQEYTINGRKIMFTKAQMYLSGFTVKGSPDQVLDDAYISINPTKTLMEIGEVVEGEAQGVAFNVGIDSVANHADPTALPASSPLSALNPDFEHWAWASGYRFIVLEGMLDTTAAANGTADTYFEMHIGGDPQLRYIDLTKQATIEIGADFVYNITVDYAELLNGVNLQSDYITHTMDNMPLAQTIVGNVADAFAIQ